MGRAKLPRKSTNIDMTAMCDVAFLLLSFFILATKTKAPEIVNVSTPSSVSTSPIKKENQLLVTINHDGKVFLSVANKEKRKAIVTDLNTRLQLQLSPADIANTDQAEIFATPLQTLKSYLVSIKESQAAGDKLPGIPAKDSTNNQLNDWLESAVAVYANSGDQMNLIVKGDNVVKYPVFKNVIAAFKKNDLMKFNIITSQEGLDKNTDLFKEKMSGNKEAGK